MSKKSSEKANFNGSGIGKVIAVILIIIIIIFAVLFLLSRHGFGFGKGNNSSDSSAVPAIAQIQESETSSDNTVSTTTSTTAAENYIEVKIDENNYLYNNTKYSVENIDQLIELVRKIRIKRKLLLYIFLNYIYSNILNTFQMELSLIC